VRCRCHHRYPLEEPRPTPIGRGFSLATASTSVPAGWPAGYAILICFDRKSVHKFDRDAAGHGVRNTPNPAAVFLRKSETIYKPRRVRFCWRAEFSSRHRQNAGGGFSLARLWTPGPPDRCRCEGSASTRHEPNPGSAYRAEISFRADAPPNLGNGFRSQPFSRLSAIGVVLTFAGLFGNRVSYFDC
jgi:hypothetical protein